MSDGHIGTPTARTVAARLDDLRGIENGWLDGCGLAPSAEGLDWLAQCFGRLAQCYESRVKHALPPTYLYPTAEGGVQAEWSFGPYEITLKIDLSCQSGQWHAVHTAAGWDDWKQLDLAQSESWSLIADNIGNYLLLGWMHS